MKTIQAVIGANFGDEGKGLMTDYLAARINKGLVVRFNGGAQAGHTVTTAEGQRHVFGHIGSGAFAGLPTYLSRHFVINPLLFNKELNALRKQGVNPGVFVDHRCMVTTPYDMMVNQIAESWRGQAKHGSCGVGFNETITRCLAREEFALTFADLADPGLIREKLSAIQSGYIPGRLKDLGVTEIPSRYQGLLASEAVGEGFLAEVDRMLAAVKAAGEKILHVYDAVLFEGAQGLLLDQNHPYFPHVTRSNTGVRNVVELLQEAGLEQEKIELVYLTRAYLTRHGAGPFPSELPEKPYPRIEDLTNVLNPYQDSLRYGLLDLDDLATAIRHDLQYAVGLRHEVQLGITCLDQLDGVVDYYQGGKPMQCTVEDFVQRLFAVVGAAKGYLSYGPTRETVSRSESGDGSLTH